ncbi:MAG TPA: flippase-like domain-containing protein [Desulfobulbus sp.]|nr:flippase-like domain-containing protein [Desulfobulbus sp.]
MKRYWLLAILSLALSLGIPLLLGGPELLPVLARLEPLWLLLLLGMILVGWNFNACRLRLLAGGTGTRIGHLRALGILVSTEFAICATPGGTGGPVTYTWLLRQNGIPASRSLALYAVDQFMDMLFFLAALLSISLYWLLIPADLPFHWELLTLGCLLVTGLTTSILLVRRYRLVLLVSGRILRFFRLSPKTRRRMARGILAFRRNLQMVRGFRPSRLLAIYLFCSGHWLLRYSVLYLAARGLGGTISWSYALLVQMFSLTAGHLTLLPGGSGGAEFSGSLLLATYLDQATAAAAVLIWRFVTFYWYLIAGAPVFSLMAGLPLWRRLNSDG